MEQKAPRPATEPQVAEERCYWCERAVPETYCCALCSQPLCLDCLLPLPGDVICESCDEGLDDEDNEDEVAFCLIRERIGTYWSIQRCWDEARTVQRCKSWERLAQYAPPDESLCAAVANRCLPSDL